MSPPSEDGVLCFLGDRVGLRCRMVSARSDPRTKQADYDRPVAAIVAYGVVLPPSDVRPDFTPIVSMVVAICLARFVVGLRLTPMIAVLAAFAGSLWAALAEGLGIVPPSVAALALVLGLRGAVRRASSRGTG